MAKYELRQRALEMRKLGMSYSSIKSELGVSKSTLSLWLRDMPLSKERVGELRDRNERRIERYRATRTQTREQRLKKRYDAIAQKIGPFTTREFFVSGIILYWAEGTKASPGAVYMTNTDPSMLRFFIEWLGCVGISRDRVKGYLHLYEDMHPKKETLYWSQELGLPISAFRKPYIKSTSSDKRKNYKGRFGHGTCNIYVHDRELYDMIMGGIEHISKNYRGS